MANKNQKEPLQLSEVISTIDVNIKPFLRGANAREQFLDDYSNCPLCGSELLYTHVTKFVDNTVHEEAHCEACKIKAKNNDHFLQ